MPRAKVWPEVLPEGTHVLAVRGEERVVGVVARSAMLGKSRIYQVDVDGHGTRFTERFIRPLDLTDPDDVEVWLNG